MTDARAEYPDLAGWGFIDENGVDTRKPVKLSVRPIDRTRAPKSKKNRFKLTVNKCADTSGWGTPVPSEPAQADLVAAWNDSSPSTKDKSDPSSLNVELPIQSPVEESSSRFRALMNRSSQSQVAEQPLSLPLMTGSSIPDVKVASISQSVSCQTPKTPLDSQVEASKCSSVKPSPAEDQFKSPQIVCEPSRRRVVSSCSFDCSDSDETDQLYDSYYTLQELDDFSDYIFYGKVEIISKKKCLVVHGDRCFEVIGEIARNRALHGDFVALFIPATENESECSIVRVIQRQTTNDRIMYAGRFNYESGVEYQQFIPSDEKQPQCLVLHSECMKSLKLIRQKLGDPTINLEDINFVVNFYSWDTNSEFPYAKIDTDAVDYTIERRLSDIEQRRASQSTPTPEVVEKPHPKPSAAPAKKPPLRRVSSGKVNAKSRAYTEYLSLDEVQTGYESGELEVGFLSVTSFGSNAFVSIPALDYDICIEGTISRNRAYSGDRVAIRLVNSETPSSKKPCGEVVSIVNSSFNSETPVPGYVEAWGTIPISESTRECKFVPIDSRIPAASLSMTQIPGDLSGDIDLLLDSLLCVNYLPWNVSSRRPTARYCDHLGYKGDMHTEINGLLLKYGIRHSETFSSQVMQEAEAYKGWIVSDSDRQSREDFTERRVFSITQSSTKGIDSALSVRETAAGGLEVCVHVSDVVHFANPGSHLDREARKRSSTITIGNSCFPILPPVLSHNICSLIPGKERLSYSVVFKIDSNGQVDTKSFDFIRSIVRSQAKLDYTTAQACIDMDPHCTVDASIANDIRLLNNVASTRRLKRKQNGALDLSVNELSFYVDNATDLPIYFEKKIPNQAQLMVEELLLIANEFCARRQLMLDANAAILRVHSSSKFNSELKQLCRHFKIDPTLETPLDYQNTMSALASIPVGSSFTAADILTSHYGSCLKNAKFVASGSVKRSKWGHFNHNLGFFSHFTSPTLHYADILSQRILSGEHIKPKLLDKAASRCNRAQSLVSSFESNLNRLYLALLVEVDAMKMDAIVVRINRKFIRVYIPSLCIVETITSKHLIEDRGVVLFDTVNDDRPDVCASIHWKREDLEEPQEIRLYDQVKVELDVNSSGMYDLQTSFVREDPEAMVFDADIDDGADNITRSESQIDRYKQRKGHQKVLDSYSGK